MEAFGAQALSNQLLRQQKTTRRKKIRRCPVILENAVENHFTAILRWGTQSPRAQYPVGAHRTYSKIKFHLFSEAIDHLDFDLNLCFS
jgi:hypothetical protein